MMSNTYTPTNSYQNTSVENRIFVGGLSLGATETDIRNHFFSFGYILQVDMPLSKSGEKKGFAIVHFDSPNGVENALSVKIHEIRGKRVAVRKALDSSEASLATKSMQEKKIFASGFRSHVTEEEVFQLFSSFGKIVKILSPKGGVGKRGFCYIIMKEKEDFDQLIYLGELSFYGCQVSVQPACTKHLLKEKPSFKKRNTQTQSSPANPHAPLLGHSHLLHQDRNLPFEGGTPSSSHYSSSHPTRPRGGAGVQHRLDQSFRGCDFQPYSPSHHSLDSSCPPESATSSFNHNSHPAFHEIISDRSDGMQGFAREPVNYSSHPQEGLKFRVNHIPLAYEFKDKYTSKKNLNYLTGILPGLNPHERVEVEIVQDINTVVTIRDKKKTSAIKAIFEEQTTYFGDF